jgi:hypothetical protein
MSRLSDARATLHAALKPVVEDPINGLALSVERVHQWPAPQPNAPCVWIEQPSGVLTEAGRQSSVLINTVTFPVAVVFDGSDRAQVAGLDELVARVWDQAWAAGGRPVRFRPGPVNVGGPSLRATYVDVEMTVRSITFCDPVPARTLEVPVG